jgi:outer membrane immunogenic protein
MRRFATALLATTASIGLSLTATAADLPVKAPIIKAPAAADPWTGCYIGGNIGYGRMKKQFYRPSDNANDGFHTADGFVGGGQIGCDYQFSSRWVVGAQGLLDWTDLKGSHVTLLRSNNIETTTASWFGTLTGRVGFLMTPDVLAYLKGGGAWVRDQHVETFVDGAPSRSAELTRSGWIVGGGLEWKFVRNWSAFVEYNFMDFGTKRVQYTSSFSQNIDQDIQTVLVGVNYRFGYR